MSCDDELKLSGRDPIEIRLPQGGIYQYLLKKDPDGTLGLQLGVFDVKCWGDNQTGQFFRVVYAKISDEEFRLTVDTRLMNSRSYGDGTDPNAEFVKINIENLDSDKYVDCILSIDLGNTRTVSLLVDDIKNTQNKINIYPVPMSWSIYGKKYQTEGDQGIFDSWVSFVNSTSDDGSFSEDAWRKSFLRIGSLAKENSRDIRRGIDGFYMLSSPKLYYWDQDSAPRSWQAVYRPFSEGGWGDSRQEILGGDLVRQFTNREHRNLSPSEILGGMVIELYEQALAYVCSKDFYDKTRNNDPRRITTVHITYPSTLSNAERIFYLKQLRKGVENYQKLFSHAFPFNLRSEFDEATAALSVYIFSKVINSSAKFFLQTVGRRMTTNGYAARLAVIDVGGGTTDLSIVEATCFDSDSGTNPSKIKLEQMFRDGMNQAGDAFLELFLRKAVRKLWFESLLKNTSVGLTPAEIGDNYDAHVGEPSEVEAKRIFWFDLVIQVALKCDKMSQYKDRSTQKIYCKFSDDAYDLWDGVLTRGGVKPQSFKDKFVRGEYEIEITKELVDLYQKSIERIFKNVAKKFGRAIYCYDIDVVLFSGKTAELYQVKEVFQKYIPLNSETSISAMKDLSPCQWSDSGKIWCGKTILDENQRIADSKISTALGGALYALKDRTFVSIDYNLFNTSTNLNYSEWGLLTFAGTFEDPIFQNDTESVSLPFSGSGIKIGRKESFASTVVPSYEIRVKPSVQRKEGKGSLQSGAMVHVEKDRSTGGLKITDCKGKFVDGTDLKVDHLECRIHA